MLVCSRMLLSRRAWRSVVVGSVLSAVAFAPPGPATAAGAAPGSTTRVSVSSTGAQANSDSRTATISADGRYVAFESVASNLVPGDTNNAGDVFVRDGQTGVTSRVSVSGTGAQANGDNYIPAISPNGRYVVFLSTARNLVPGDTNGAVDVFVRDREAGTTRRVSVSSAGVQANAESEIGTSVISANGRYIVFESTAMNLVPGDANHSNGDVFLRDMQAGTTRRINVSSEGVQADGFSGAAAISADGRYVTFGSDATNLVRGDTNDAYDMFLRDRTTGITRRISVSSAGVQTNGASFDPTISADGRYVTFYSDATNLVPGDTNNTGDVFLRDTTTGITRRVSVSSAGAQSDSDSYNAAISPDGRSIAFDSNATNLVPGDTNAVTDVFVRNWATGVTRRVSVSSAGAQANDESGYAAISSGGRHVTFRSLATNLVPGATNASLDIFVRAQY